ncbi:MAG TPA: hypothetical protein VGJ73_03500 [Verrucomicrobiae bacterium]
MTADFQNTGEDPQTYEIIGAAMGVHRHDVSGEETSRPFGTRDKFHRNPALKRRAISNRPHRDEAADNKIMNINLTGVSLG